VLAWDDQRFSLEDDYELSDINVGGTVRAPLVGRMRERSTDQEFLFVVNHLWRSEAGEPTRAGPPAQRVGRRPEPADPHGR
jgi:hypothetical protein